MNANNTAVKAIEVTGEKVAVTGENVQGSNVQSVVNDTDALVISQSKLDVLNTASIKLDCVDVKSTIKDLKQATHNTIASASAAAAAKNGLINVQVGSNNITAFIVVSNMMTINIWLKQFELACKAQKVHSSVVDDMIKKFCNLVASSRTAYGKNKILLPFDSDTKMARYAKKTRQFHAEDWSENSWLEKAKLDVLRLEHAENAEKAANDASEKVAELTGTKADFNADLLTADLNIEQLTALIESATAKLMALSMA